MQSIKNIYEKIYDFENLHKAWEEARKGKRYRDDVLIFNRNYEEQLINIQNHLIYETYEVGKYHTFYVYEPKKRLIMSLSSKAHSDPASVSKGDIVTFTGGGVYKSSTAEYASVQKNVTSTCKVTAVNTKGTHPYHCISQDGKGVYGWVNAADVK